MNTAQDLPIASIIIRSYNEAEKIGQCLSAVFGQHCPDSNGSAHRDMDRRSGFEVIIVDSGSTDNTVSIASAFPTRIVTMRKSDFTYGRSLNIGADAARGAYLVFLSAHAVPTDSNWLEHLIARLEQSDSVAGAFGPSVPWPDCNPIQKRFIESHWQEKTDRNADEFCNANSIVRRKVWEKFRFDESLSASEDQDWAHRVEAAGYEIAYEPNAAVLHSHNESIAQAYRRSLKEFHTSQRVRGRIDFSLLTLGAYGFVQDIRYIFKKTYNPAWIFRSLAICLTITLAAIHSYARLAMERLSRPRS